MKGSVKKRGGRWAVRWREPDGRQRQKTFVTKREAERALIVICGDIDKGTYQPPKEILFRDLCDKWLKKSKGDIKPLTYISYRGHIKNYLRPRFGHLQVRAISTETIDLFKADLEGQISPRTIGHILTTLKSVLKIAVRWHYAAANPASDIKKPPIPYSEMDFLNPDEIKRLLAATDQRHYALMLCACMTGMRRGELLALRWSDVDFVAKTISLKKQAYKGRLVDLKTGHSRRRISISDTLIDTLREHQTKQIVDGPENPMGLIFPSEAGTPIDGTNLLRRIFWPTLSRAGLRRVRLHDLRHSYAAILISRNVPLKVIQRQMGHSSIQVTADTYGHLLPESESAAATELEAAIFGTVEFVSERSHQNV